MSIAERLKEYRSKKKLSQRKLAEMMGISAGTLSKLERGSMEPTPAIMEKIRLELGSAAVSEPVANKEPAPQRTAEEEAMMRARDEQIRRDAEEAVARVQKEAANAEIRGKLVLELEKREGPLVMIQSQTDEVTMEKILHQVWKAEPRAEKIYVKPCENRAYWTYGEESGWVWLW